MNKLKKSLTGFAAAFALIAILAGCAGDSALIPSSGDNSELSGQTSSGEIHLMETDTTNTPLLKHRKRENAGLFFAEKYIEADEGGKIEVEIVAWAKAASRLRKATCRKT